MANYVMLSVGSTTTDFNIRLVNNGINCDSSTISSLSSIVTSAFPTFMNRMQHHTTVFVSETSTLVACGGNEVIWFPFPIQGGTTTAQAATLKMLIFYTS